MTRFVSVCDQCGAESEDVYRCEGCGKDLTGVETQRRGSA